MRKIEVLNDSVPEFELGHSGRYPAEEGREGGGTAAKGGEGKEGGGKSAGITLARKELQKNDPGQKEVTLK